MSGYSDVTVAQGILMSRKMTGSSACALALALLISAMPAHGQEAANCELRVYPAETITGVTTKSGLAKFALGVVLPSVVGSVAGAVTGANGWDASKLLFDQTVLTGSSLSVRRTGDVPEVIADRYAPSRQAAMIADVLAAQPDASSFAAPLLGEHEIPDRKEVAHALEASGHSCMQILTIDSITFEHSKDYTKRNAVVVGASLSQYVKGRKKPETAVSEVLKTSITTYSPEMAQPSPELEQSLETAFREAVTNLVAKFQKKQK